MKKRFLLSVFLTVFSTFSFGLDYYWIGGSGNWSDVNHWSLTSGGAPAAVIPGALDNAIFDASSNLNSVADIVTMDVAVTITNFDFSAVPNAFTLSSGLASIEVGGNLTSNGMVVFDWVGGEIFMNSILPVSITSNGTIWEQNFRFDGTSCQLADVFDIGLNIIFVDGGIFNSGGFMINCGIFESNNPGPRTINITNSVVNINGGLWNMLNATNLTISATGSVINMSSASLIGAFNGANESYNELRSTLNSLDIYFDNSFQLIEIPPSSVCSFENGSLNTIDSLIAGGDCVDPVDFLVIGGGSADIQKTGYPQLEIYSAYIDGVNALGAATYNLYMSNVVSGTGWTPTATSFYWIGDSGNWTDLNHWSFSSGGAVAGCLPGPMDSVFFDINSFSATGANVLVDDEAPFGTMIWSGFLGTQTLSLDSNMVCHGDIFLDPNLTLKRNLVASGVQFIEQSNLAANGAAIDCNFLLTMANPASSVNLLDNLVMSDTSSILIFNGKLITQNNDVVTGSIVTIDDTGSATDSREIDLGSSFVHVKQQFSSAGDATLSLLEGTSHLYVGDTIRFVPDTISYGNGLLTEGLTFYDVTLNFQPLNMGPFPLQQKIAGSNTFNKLKVIPGSHIYIDSSSTQTVNDSLILEGNCLDSITINSTGSTQANIDKATAADVIAHCLNLRGINASGTALTAYFSNNITNNTNWTFSALNSVNASFTTGGSFCYGDTVLFNNTSTAFSGDPNDITSYWFFNDGSTGYYANPPTDSTWITYVTDTNQHVFTDGGAFNVSLITTYTNFCRDTATQLVTISRPLAFMTTTEFDLTICQNDPVTFEASSPIAGTTFQFLHNGVAQNSPPTVNDTLFTTTSIADGDTIQVIGFEGVCPSDSLPTYIYNVNPLPAYTWTSTDADTSICAQDEVTFDATSADLTYVYQYQVNGTGVTGFTSAGIYTTSSLADNDTVSLIGKTTNGCRDTLEMYFNVDPLPATTLTESTGSSIICAGTSITFTAAGATTYEFFVNGVSQGAPGTGNTWTTSALTSSDTVSVVGYFATGCSKEASQTYTYNVLPLPSVSMTSSDFDNTICSGESVTFSASGASQYDFYLNGTSVTGFTPIDTYTNATLNDGDIVHVVGSSSGCTQASTGLTFTVVASPATSLSSSDADQTICQGESVTLTGSGATNYEFFVDGVSQGGSSAVNTFTTTTLLDGQVVTVTGESNSCTVNDNMTFTVLPIPTVNLFSNDPDNVICDGDPITLTGANAVQYELFINGASQGPAQASATFSNPTLPIGTNTVFVQGTAPNGCTNTSQPPINITVNPIPVVGNTSSDADNIICAGESVTFTGSGSNMYQFYVDGVPQGSMSATNTFTTSGLTNGQSVNIIGSSLGCTSTSNAITTTVNTVPIVSLTNTDANNIWCIDETITFTANGATNYEFLVDGVSQGPASPTNSINSSGFGTGTFTVEVVGETNNCSNTSSNTVTINPLPSPSIISSDTDNTICSGDPVTYTSAGGSLYEFFLNGVSQGAPSTLSDFSSSSLVDGDVIAVTATSSAGCAASVSSLPINVNPTPTVSLASSDIDQQICIGDNVDFTGSGANDYEFFINGVSQGAPSATSTFSTTTLSNGDVIEVTGTSLGCSNVSNTLAFNVYGPPVVSLYNNGDIQICTGENTDLTASGASTYQFEINGTPVGGFSPTANFTGVLNDGDVVTVIGETNGCTTTSMDTYTFTVFDYPTITSSSSDIDNIICLDDLITISASGAMEYEFNVNGIQYQFGTSSTFDINTLEDGDLLSVIGYNGDCPSTPDNYSFTVNSMILDLDVSPSSMICEGETAIFTGSGADEYEFFLNGSSVAAMGPSNSFSTATLTDLDEITFTGYNSTTGCTQSFGDFILMNVLNEPMISPAGPVDFCEGDSVVLTSNASYGNQWYLDGNPILGANDTSFIAYSSGQYTVEVTAGGNGSVWSFGQNATGIFGDSSNLNNADPTAIASSLSFDELSSGFRFLLGITTSGDVYSWGENNSGQLGLGTFTSSNVPVQVPSLTSVKTAATTEASAMAVTTSGDVYVWGNNNQGQLGTGNTSVINFPFLNSSLSNTDTIAAGRRHFVILKNDGTVWTVGNNDYGQLGQGNLVGSMIPVQVTSLSNVVSVGAGEYHSFAIDANGDLYVWGNNGSGQLGLNDLNNRLVPTISGLRNVVNAQGGANHSAFLTTDKKVFTSGGNAFGQLGNGTLNSIQTPGEVAISGAQQISTGQYTTLVLRQDRSVFGFGNNTDDQLSSISGNTVPSPEHIADLDGVAFVEASQLSSHFIYSEEHGCTSQPVDLNMLTTPLVSITANGDTLSTISGTAYQWYFNGSVIPGATSQTYVANASGNYSVEVTFANGCSGTSSDYYHSMTEIKEIADGFISLYPNPSSDFVNIQFGSESTGSTVHFFDQTGRLVLTIDDVNTQLVKVDVGSLDNGVYNVLVLSEGLRTNLRFIKSVK